MECSIFAGTRLPGSGCSEQQISCCQFAVHASAGEWHLWKPWPEVHPPPGADEAASPTAGSALSLDLAQEHLTLVTFGKKKGEEMSRRRHTGLGNDPTNIY